MKPSSQLIIALAIISFTSFLFCNSALAKSVYAITDHEASTLKAYKIIGDQLQYQANVDVTNYASGAVGISIDSNLKLLFITYENSGKIVWADARSLEQKGFIDLSSAPINATQLAGIVADEEKQRVYVVERQDDKLYILFWDEEQEKLILMNPDDPNQPYSSGDPYVTLTNLEPEEAYGITLNDKTRRLYISNATSSVHIYGVDNGFSHLGTRDVGRAVADVAVDPNNGQHNAFLYCGALYAGPGDGHEYLIKHDLEANTTDETDINTVPIGIAVDVDSGLVYTSTSDKQIRVYDCTSVPFVMTDFENTNASELSAGAGICVPLGDVF